MIPVGGYPVGPMQGAPTVRYVYLQSERPGALMNAILNDHRTRLHSRREVRALCAAVRIAVDAVERAGQLSDDSAEAALSTLERWSFGDVVEGELSEVIEQMGTLVHAHSHLAADVSPALAAMTAAVDCVARTARDVEWAGGEHDLSLDRTALWWAETVLELLGEDSDAAVARIAIAWDGVLHEPMN